MCSRYNSQSWKRQLKFVFQSLQAVSLAVPPGHPLHLNLETILQKVPTELRDRMSRRQLPDDTPTDVPTEKALIRLHKQVRLNFNHNYGKVINFFEDYKVTTSTSKNGNAVEPPSRENLRFRRHFKKPNFSRQTL